MRRAWRAFLVVSIGVFLSVLDLFIVNVAVPSLRTEFPSASLAELSWVLNAYAIVFAATLVPAGKLGDLYGRRRLFVAGLALFLAGSGVAAVAPSVPWLVGARMVQGLGAAALTPNALGVALPAFPPGARAAAVGAWAAIGGVGAAAGPVLGGLLAEVNWRWIFLVNIPLGAIALILVPRLVAEIRQVGDARLPDPGGSILLMGSIGSLTLALSQGPDWDWDRRVLTGVAISAALAILFVRRSVRHPAAVIEPSLLAERGFGFASLATLAFFAAFAATLVSSVLFLTDIWRFSVLQAGLALAVGPITAAVVAGLASRRAGRMAPGLVGGLGSLIFAASLVWFVRRLGAEAELFAAFLPGQLVGGIGVGLALPALTRIAVAGLPPDRLATGIGVQTMFRQVGAAIGVAIWVATIGGAALSSVADFRPGWVAGVAMSMSAGVLILATTLPAGHRQSSGGAVRPASPPHYS
jgi:EmrB/QacA subfamily drug resistance transporter